MEHEATEQQYTLGPGKRHAGIEEGLGSHMQVHMHHIRLRRVRRDGDTGDGAQHPRNGLGALVVGGEARQPAAQIGTGGEDVGVELHQVAAVAAQPEPRLRDEVRRTGQGRAGDGADALVEGDIDAVEERGDLGVGAIVERAGLPQPRAIHVHGDATVARPGHLRFQVRPGRELPADLALRQFQQQRGERAGRGAQIVEGKEPRALADQPAMQSMQ